MDDRLTCPVCNGTGWQGVGSARVLCGLCYPRVPRMPVRISSNVPRNELRIESEGDTVTVTLEHDAVKGWKWRYQ